MQNNISMNLGDREEKCVSLRLLREWIRKLYDYKLVNVQLPHVTPWCEHLASAYVAACLTAAVD